jgi:hypothetical protein
MDITHGSSVDDESWFDPAKIHEHLSPGWCVIVNGLDYQTISVNASELKLVPARPDTGEPIPGAQPITMRWDEVSTIHIP